VNRLQIVLAATALAVVCGVTACGGPGDATSSPSTQTGASASPSASQSPTQAQQADLRIKEGVHAISVGLQSWAASQSTVHYPPAADRATLGKYMTDPWPVDPLTGADMKPGGGPGDYSYRVAADKKSCRVTGYLSDGTPYSPQVLQ
jgi:hypothetical protein